MTDDVEQIQAKLVAYLDGELTGPERAEIERHLRSHPTHMALMKQLMRHRQLLRSLPVEKAPPDLLENLQAQLEREALLSDLHPAPVVLRIHRWYPVLAAAAVFLLAIGLGVVIFSMLPSRKPAITMADLRESPPEDERKSEEREKTAAADSAKTGDAEGLMRATPRPSRSFGGRGGAAIAAKPAPEPADRGKLAYDKSKSYAVTAGRLMADVEIDRDAGVITINAENARAADARLQNYLEENKVAWSDESQLRDESSKDRAPGRADWQRLAQSARRRDAYGGRGGDSKAISRVAEDDLNRGAVFAKRGAEARPDAPRESPNTQVALAEPKQEERVAATRPAVAVAKGLEPPTIIAPPRPEVRGPRQAVAAGAAFAPNLSPATQQRPEKDYSRVIVARLNVQQVDALSTSLFEVQKDNARQVVEQISETARAERQLKAAPGKAAESEDRLQGALEARNKADLAREVPLLNGISELVLRNYIASAATTRPAANAPAVAAQPPPAANLGSGIQALFLGAPSTRPVQLQEAQEEWLIIVQSKQLPGTTADLDSKAGAREAGAAQQQVPVQADQQQSK